MKYTFSNGASIQIPTKEIDNLMSSLDLTKDEAIDLWLADNDYEVNEEQQKLDNKAKNAKINHETGRKESKNAKKPIKVKVSDEKKELFTALKAFLSEYCSEKGGKCEILTENKLFLAEINGKKFKIDLIQQRK